jgi:citrate lyase beta subunit
VRHFDNLDAVERKRLFQQEPGSIDHTSTPEILGAALGATLYVPAIRPDLVGDIAKLRRCGIVSLVLCLEDAIPDECVLAAEQNVISALRQHALSDVDGPFIFIRVRSPYQIPLIVKGLDDRLPVLSGFVLPKFTAHTGPPFLTEVVTARDATGQHLYVMPVIESPEVMFLETRAQALDGIRCLVEEHRSNVLAVRIGATDLCASFGVRRSRDLSIYDVQLVAGVISDVVNVLGRTDRDHVPIAGPVWEYFPVTERRLKPQIRASPFARHDDHALRDQLISSDLDGLIREVLLDQVNGLTGKTVIHPSHVAAVHAMNVVSDEEYRDCQDILTSRPFSGGAHPSAYHNKMNEARPHRSWAERTNRRAHIFGVARPGISFADLLAAGTR